MNDGTNAIMVLEINVRTIAVNIVIYSTKTCGFCNMLKKYLTDHNVAYEEKLADENPDYAEELFAKSQQLAVPYTIITDDSGKEVAITGFDKPKIDSVLGIA